ncbi:hypothetical protein [Frigoribacterium salinisoli]
MPSHASARPRRSRTTPLALTTGLVGSTLLALSLTGTLSGFTASITNDPGTAGTGTLAMEQRLVSSDRSTAGTVGATCTSGSSAACTSVDLLGGDLGMTPGGPSSTVAIDIVNTGTTPAGSFTVDLGDCVTTPQPGRATSTSTGELCDHVLVAVSTGGRAVFEGRLTDVQNLAGLPVAPPPGPGGSVRIEVVVRIDGGAGDDVQGLQVAMPVTWRFTS